LLCGFNMQVLSFALVLLLVAAAPRAYSAYVAEQIAVLPEGSARVIRALNDNDEIVGGARLQGRHLGFRGKKTLRSVEGLPGSDYSNTLGINNEGDVVGSANAAKGVRAFRAGPRGQLALGTLPGDQASEAFAVNKKGEAAGYSSGVAGIRAVTWSKSGEISLLPELAAGKTSKAFAINDDAIVVGISGDEAESRAVRWSGGSVQDLGALPGDVQSEALAINAGGEIVGSSGDPLVRQRAVLWNPDASIEELGSLPGGESSRALGVNDAGQVVGVAQTHEGSFAFVWSRAEGMQNLNDLVSGRAGYVLTEAVAINSRGVILAIGQEDIGGQDGHSHDLHELPIQVFLLRPVP
jgi:probable HAF family extracellular repeat protein